MNASGNMNNHSYLLSAFNSNFTVLSETENFTEYKLEIEVSGRSHIESDIVNLLGLIASSDKWTVFFSEKGNENSILSYSKNPDVKSFVNDVLKFASTDHFSLSINVVKEIGKFGLNVYGFSVFKKFLVELEVEKLIDVFGIYISEHCPLHLNCLGTNINCQTASISFCNGTSSFSGFSINRDERLKQIEKNCHNEALLSSALIPEDFMVIQECSDVELGGIMTRLFVLSCMSSIFDFTKVVENEFHYRISGYKTLSGTLDFTGNDLKDIVRNVTEEYRLIYTWIYEGGNVSDKVGLARNILTLHFDGDNPVKLLSSPYSSIISSFEIYLKENIKQYLEVRKDVGAQLVELSNDARKIAKTYILSYEKSFVAFLGFFLTVFVSKALKSDSWFGVFNYDTWTLGVAILVLMLGYWGYSIWSFQDELKRFKHRYKNLKDRFKDVLNVEDINRILNNDEEYNGDLKYMKSRRLGFSILWIMTLIVFFCAITFLWSFHDFQLEAFKTLVLFAVYQVI